MDPITMTLLFAAAAPLIDLLEKGVISKLSESTPILRAAAATAASFRDIEGLEQTLLAWADSEAFRDLVERLRAGEAIEHEPDSAIDAFIDGSRFFVGSDTRELAESVIQSFLRAIREQLLAGPSGLAIAVARAEAMFSEQLGVLAEQGERLENISTTLAGFAPVLAPESSSASDPLGQPLDVARSLINDGKARTALDLLEEIRKGSSSGASEESLYRLEMNLGAARLDLHDAELAEGHFSRALEIRPNDVKALIALTKAHLAREQPDRALEVAERAHSAEPDNVIAQVMRLMALHYLDRDHEVDAIIAESDFGNDALASALLGELRLAQGRPADAVPLLRRGLAASDVRLPMIRLLLGVALTQVATRSEGPGRTIIIKQDGLAILTEADEWFSRAIEGLQPGTTELAEALASRAGVRALLGQLDEALADCDGALVHDNASRLALENRARVLLRMGDGQGAVDTLDRLPGPRSEELNVILAAALLRSGRAADSLAIATELWERSTIDDIKISAGELIIRSEKALGVRERTAAVLDVFRNEAPRDPLALAIRAEALEDEGDLAGSTALLRQALDEPDIRLKRHLAYELAGVLYRAGDPQGAVDVYRNIGPPDLHESEYRNFLVALLAAGHLGDALRLSADARKAIGVTSLAEVEAHVLEVIGDLSNAATLLEARAFQPDAGPEVNLQLLSLLLRLGRGDEAQRLVEGFNMDRVAGNAAALLSLAEARTLLGMPGALELAFRARNPRKPQEIRCCVSRKGEAR
jgi:tetratricopeptide (TPR) repeat protein